MSLPDAVIGLKAYKEVEERMIQLWHNLDVAIVSPRMDVNSPTLPRIHAEEVRSVFPKSRSKLIEV